MNRILVVEDEVFINLNICEILQLAGYSTKFAFDGKEAITEVISFEPNLIICDVMMPEMGGFEFIKALREIKGHSLTPVIFLTAMQEKSDIREGMNLGAEDYLLKPFEKNDLLNAVQCCFKKIDTLKESINKKVDDVVSLVAIRSAHEFNTPLNGIISSAELLLSHYNQLPKETILKLLTMIVISGYRLKFTLDNLLLYYEISSSTEKIKVSLTTEFSNIFSEMFQVFCKKENIQTIRLTDLTISIEPTVVHFSEYFLVKIIRELLNNAFKFSKEGQKVQVIGSREDNLYTLKVKDEGIGISKEQLKSLSAFKQFNREKLEQQGSGLGLYIISTLMELTELPIEINSTLGEGTEVILKFKIPL